MNRGRMDQVVEMAKWSMVDFDSVKNQIVFRIINGRMNEKELQSLVHIPVMNLAVIFVVQFGQSDEMGVSIRISKKLLEHWEMDLQDLWKIAYENTCLRCPAKSDSLDHLLRRIVMCDIPDPKEQEKVLEMLDSTKDNESEELIVLSNNVSAYGASCMIYGDALKEYAVWKQSDLVILPSSIHEVLLVKYDGSSDVRWLSRMVSDINISDVAENERLSDSVYIYRWKQDVLEDTETGKRIRPGYDGIAKLVEEMQQAS